MKKKLLSFILSICFIIPCMYILTACAEDEPCNHEWEIKTNPTETSTGLAFCTVCNKKDLILPAINNTDYTVVDTNPDYKEYTYIKNGENLEFVITNFDITYSSSYGEGYRIDGYSGNSTTIVIPDTIKYTNGTLPVTELGDEAFTNKTTITSVTLPSSLKDVGNSTFSGCTSLASINLPNGLDTIGTYTFKDTALTEVIVPNTVSLIGNSAFKGCTNLQKISVPFIGDIGASGLNKSFGTIFGNPNSNNDVPTSLKEVSITGNITTITAYAFNECTSIEKITLPNTVQLIGNESFKNCTSLKKITVGSSLQKINSEAFANCTNLESLVIPTTLTNIYNSAFLNCSSISTIYYMGTKSQWNSIDIDPTNDNNQVIIDADRYYYSETQPTAIDYLNSNRSLNVWHYDNNNEAVLWTMNFTDNVDGNSYEYYGSMVTISDETWYMLQEAMNQNMLESMFDYLEPAAAQEQIDMITTSSSKADYESKLTSYYASTAKALNISFNDNIATMEQLGDTVNIEYIEVDGEIYYVNEKVKAFIYNPNTYTIYEEYSSGFFFIQHIYTPTV